MGEILAGEATPAQIAGFAVALRAKGETTRRGLRPGRGDVRRGHADLRLRTAPRRRRHRRRPVHVGQHLHDGCDRRGRCRAPRWSSTATDLPRRNRALPTCSKRSGSVSTCRPTGSRRWPKRPESPSASRRPSTPRCACRGAATRAGHRHTFNFLGPLANPTRPAAQAIGCADPRMAPVMAGVFARRGVDAWVFRGDDGLDELTTTTTSRCGRSHDGTIAEPPSTRAETRHRARHRRVAAWRGRGVTTPTSYGVCWLARPVPVRDAVLLNAAAALAVYDEDQDGLDVRWSGWPPASIWPATSVDSGRRQGHLGAAWVSAASRTSLATLSRGRGRTRTRGRGASRRGKRCGSRSTVTPATLLSRSATTVAISSWSRTRTRAIRSI